jgi:hypothetical protein
MTNLKLEQVIKDPVCCTASGHTLRLAWHYGCVLEAFIWNLTVEMSPVAPASQT